MRSGLRLVARSGSCLVAVSLLVPVAAAQWVQFVDETATRLSVGDPSLVLTDPQEKNYAHADFDKDGDLDLAIFRKQPYLVAGPLRNVLLINQNGVLTDRTTDFASASDVPGDQGFLTPTNDRDAAVVDVDLDGWPDIVTAPTISPGAPKHVGHPRVYMNLGCATGGTSATVCTTAAWLGFQIS